MLKMNERLLCCVVAVILFFIGMCLETAETDSSFLYAKTMNVESAISSVDYLVESTDSCTTEMIGKNNTISLRGEMGRNAIRWDRSILLSIIVGAILQYLLYLNSAVRGEKYAILHSETVAVNYIHHKDGEK